jgi:hypothetical protein
VVVILPGWWAIPRLHFSVEPLELSSVAPGAVANSTWTVPSEGQPSTG